MPLSGLVPELGPIHSFVHSPGVLGFGDTEISRWVPIHGETVPEGKPESVGVRQILLENFVGRAQALDPALLGILRNSESPARIPSWAHPSAETTQPPPAGTASSHCCPHPFCWCALIPARVGETWTLKTPSFRCSVALGRVSDRQTEGRLGRGDFL